MSVVKQVVPSHAAASWVRLVAQISLTQVQQHLDIFCDSHWSTPAAEQQSKNSL